MSKDEAYLRAIVREIGYLPSELKGYSLQNFIKSDKTKKAVCMTLLNIGEAANKLSKAFRVMPRLKKDIRGILEKEFGSPE